MKGLDEKSPEPAVKKVVKEEVSPEAPSDIESSEISKPEKKFEGKGLAGVVKKLSEEKLEDKAKRIADKLAKNPDKKDKIIEKPKTTAKKAVKEEKPAPKKTTKK
ncbi:MAG: hypothetical protein WCJ45_08160 [bacterium]